MAADNPSWGCTRIQGALKNLGHRVARSTIAKILKDEGTPASRERPTTWRTFMRAHWQALTPHVRICRRIAGNRDSYSDKPFRNRRPRSAFNGQAVGQPTAISEVGCVWLPFPPACHAGRQHRVDRDFDAYTPPPTIDPLCS
jgi:hypothetical protein